LPSCHVEIPENYNITSIDNRLFEHTEIESITIPNGVIDIGSFMNCTSLITVTLGNDVKKLSSFYNCSSLQTINLPEGMTKIPGYMFSGCTSITTITLPSTINMLERCCLDCSSLNTIKYNGTVEQWNAISKEEFWYVGSSVQSVLCLDGIVSLT
jgi:hypothetical protein